MRDDQITVLQIIRNLDIGGAQEVVRTLAAYLPQAGCRVVVCTFKDGPLRQEIERLGVPVEVLPDRRHSIVALPLFVLDMARLRRRLVEVIRRHRVDVVQTHLLRIMDFLVLTLRLGTPMQHVFWTIHNYNFTLRADQLQRWRWLLGPKRFAYRLLYRVAARWVAGVIAVSEEVETAIHASLGPLRGKITVISNGVDVARYRQSQDRAVVRRALGLPHEAWLMTLVGTMKRQKGHRLLIEAAASVVPRFPDVHVLFVGDGADRAELEALAAASGVGNHLHFLGNRSDVPALLAASDAFVLPSLWEGLPMALIEAMASGLPVIASAVSGTKQVMVHGETGLLVPPGDVSALSGAMTALLADLAQAQAMGAAARRRVEAAFSARQQAEAHLALYRRAGAGGTGEQAMDKHPTNLRLVYIIGTFPSLTTTFIDREIRSLRGQGVRLRVLSIRRPVGALSAEQQALQHGVQYLLPVQVLAFVIAHLWFAVRHPLKYWGTLLYLLTRAHPTFKARLMTLLHFAEGVYAAHLLRTEPCDHVHAHFVDRAATLALVVSRLLDVPYSVTAHANDIYVNPVLLPEKLGNARFAVTCTGYNEAHLHGLGAQRFGHKLSRIYHGLDLSRYTPNGQPAPKRPVILAVGQLKEKKGFTFLLEACRMLKDRGHDFECQIVGEGPLRATLEADLRRLGLERRVTLCGALPHEAVIDRYRHATVFVLPCITGANGDRDGIPNVILEALAMQLPVVSTRHSGIPEVIEDGVNGLLVPPADTGALADALARLLNDAVARRALGRRGRQTVVEQFDAERNVQLLLEQFIA